MEELKPSRRTTPVVELSVGRSLLGIIKGAATRIATLLSGSAEQDQSGFLPKTKILRELLGKGKFTFASRRDDFENGRLKKKWEEEVAPRFLIEYPNTRTKVIKFLNSFESKVQPINVFISDKGVVSVFVDGNTRMYAAIRYEVDPHDIPVRCEQFPASEIEDVNANTTLAEVIRLAMERKN